MNEEILFRGRRLDNNEWAKGYFIKVGTKAWIITGDEFEIDKSGVPVDLDTVGQYTGLTDRKGKKIFKDDIVQDTIKNVTSLVKYERGMFYADNIMIIIAKRCRVIGNIHDNPELLEGERKCVKTNL